MRWRWEDLLRPFEEWMQPLAGRDMPHFTDATKSQKGCVKLNGDYLILYHRKDYTD